MANSQTCFPVIISESLIGGEIHQQLTLHQSVKIRSKHKHFRLRGIAFTAKDCQPKCSRTKASGTVQRGSCIFPKSSVAFLLINHQEIEHLQIDRVERFVRCHRFSYVLFQVQVVENYVIETIANINNRLFPDICSFLFADSCASAVDLMIATANAHLPATMELSCEAAATFSKKASSNEMATEILSGLGLAITDRDLVRNGCESLVAVTESCAEELVSLGLDEDKASELKNFFEEDYLAD